MNKRHFSYLLHMVLLLIVVVAGWFATDYLGNKARQEIIGESQGSVLTLTIHVSSTLANIEGAVKALAGSPWIAPALMSKRDQDLERANSTLDRYNSASDASVSYLMAADGMTVASSNRYDPDNFVGRSYGFRPYFQEAANCHAGRYFALGITSGKRGFYASFPVQNSLGNVLGVVTMKKDLDEMEGFFSKYPFCFLISRDGIIFLSSTPAMVLKTLWPPDKAVRDTLVASRQFGNKVPEAVLKKEIADGAEVTLEGKDYFVSRKVIDTDGWSIVLLTPTHRIGIYRLIGILATISVGFLIMAFSGIIYVTDRSQGAIRQSEESKHLLLHAVGEGIFGVDATGQATFANPAAIRMLGFAEEEMLGQRLHALIHHSHKDGSNYPVEDCPMYASYTKAAESHVTDELFWRRDGSSFPVEYSSMPITRDGKVMGAVVTFKDITERKQSEEILRESEEKFRAIFDGASDGILIADAITNTFFQGNVAICSMLGYTKEEIGSLTITDIHPPIDLPHVIDEFEKLMKGEKDSSEDLPVLRKDGTIFYANISSTSMTIRGIHYLVGIFRDTTERKQAEEKIRQMAYHDGLTGLPNRKLFSDRLGIALAQAQRNKKEVGIAMLDLDNFKDVNDTLGHDVGDLLLKATAERLSAALRKSDTVARLGGDEFALILPDLEAMEDAILVVQKIVDSFCKPFLIDTHQLVVTTSIGIAVYPDDGTDEGILLKNADSAMYQAKQAGRARYQLYEKAEDVMQISFPYPAFST
jgi:diguanylate cyclase (GGDEF)-like protein/PAS domain S-box-containing protein